jgi:glycosyltransferase involved in cell wall biosynthesis
VTPLLVVMDKMYGRGGTEGQVLRLLPALHRAGVEARLLFLRSDPLHARVGLECEWRELDIGGLLPFGGLRAARAVRAEARRQGARVIMSFFDDAMAVAALVRVCTPGVRFVATQRSLGMEREPSRQVWVGWALRQADQILVNSTPIKEAITGRYGQFAERLLVIENLPPVQAARYGPVPVAVRAAVEELRRTCSTVAVIVAGLRPVKGVQDAVEALAAEPARSAGVGLVVFGDGPLRVDLESQVASLGLGDRVRFAGFRTDVGAALGLFDFALLPSHHEGNANAGLEFAAAGLPLLATRIGGNAWLLDESAAGLGVPPQDPLAMSRAIAELAGDAGRRRELAARARAFSAQRPSEADVVGQYLSVLRRLEAEVAVS